MIKRVGAMPPGTVGFQTVGDVYDEDWEEVVQPVLDEVIEAEEKVRMLLIVGPKNRAVDGVSVGSDLGFRARHGGSFERLAVVSDEDWMWPALGVLSFVIPVRARGFSVADLPEAISWLTDD
ncbi:MAG: STAS/SEC14 domain-containing protein [Actinobacteria bacterium]|nr:STAS/SEC14 domain-containing protein [Actinomycetota bacterium]